MLFIRTAILTLLLTLPVAGPVTAQSVLTMEDAIRIGLEQNFGIQIGWNEAEIARLNHTFGNAGFLPRVDLSAARREIHETESLTEGGSFAGRDEAEISLLTAGAELQWTLFDGLKMFVTYEKLGELRELGETEARLQVELAVSQIIEGYYEIVRQEMLLRVLQSGLEFSEERYRIARSKRELGSGSEYELLLARSDLNTDRGAMMRQEVAVSDAKRALVRLLNLPADEPFGVSDRIEIDESLLMEELYPKFLQQNREMDAARIRQRISGLELREMRRERYPQIDFNMGATYNREEIRNGLLLLERTDGLYVGLTARVPLFDGLNRNRQIQVAQVRHRNETIRLEEELTLLETEFRSQFDIYTSAIRLIGLESENLQLAQEALDIALEQFRLASITSIELRETQRILLDTENRLIDARYAARVSETELKRLSGLLGEDLSGRM